MACGTDVILLFVVLYLYDVTLRIESPTDPSRSAASPMASPCGRRAQLNARPASWPLSRQVEQLAPCRLCQH